jgi:hypothetical protein
VEEAEQIRANHWRQGCVLLPEQLPEEVLASFSLPVGDGRLLYVLTHDCDLVQADFTKEPYVELLLITPVSVADGNLTHGKNSRLLDFNVGVSAYRASCHDRFRIDRQLLAKQAPSAVHPIDTALCDLITDWISKRYIRPAFPDAFNIRLNREARAIRKYLKKYGQMFERIYIICNPQLEELSDDEDYQLTVWLVLEDPEAGPGDVRTAQELVVQLEQILDGCRGIKVLDCRVVRESEITLAHLRILSLWDFDDLSYRALQS